MTLLNRAVLLTSLAIPLASFTVAPTVLRAQDHRYHDTARNEDHTWDKHEDKAYHMWAKEQHRKSTDFSKLKPEDQQSYWAWRHDHSDAVLKIKL